MIYLITGGKGGVGKSMIAKLVVCVLRSLGFKVIAIDSDYGNPTLWTTFEQVHDADPSAGLYVDKLDLRVAEGWARLMNLCNEMPDHIVVIDTPAGNQEALAAYSKLLLRSLPKLDREWQSIFVTSGERDSVDLLAAFHAIMPEDHVVHVVMNLFFGSDARSWARFNGSKTKAKVALRSGELLAIPRLASYLVSDIGWAAKPFDTALATSDVGDEAVLGDWLGAAHAQFEPVFQRASRRAA